MIVNMPDVRDTVMNKTEIPLLVELTFNLERKGYLKDT